MRTTLPNRVMYNISLSISIKHNICLCYINHDVIGSKWWGGTNEKEVLMSFLKMAIFFSRICMDVGYQKALKWKDVLKTYIHNFK